MASGSYGSDSKPVSLDPFQTIVEVGWGSKYYSDHGIIFSKTTTNANCSPSTGIGFPPGDNLTTVYVTEVFYNVTGNNGPGSIHPVKPGKPALSGTFFSFPEGILSAGVGKWTAAGNSVTLSGSVSHSRVRIVANAPEGINIVCRSFGVTLLEVATMSGANDFHSHSRDFGAASFIDTDSGDEYNVGKLVYNGADATGIAFRILWKRAP